MPAIRAMCYPCLCLCFAFVQMTRTTPRRRTTLHLSQIRFTDALTFMMSVPSGLCLSDYPAARAVSCRQLHNHPIAHEQSDEVPLHAARCVRRDRTLSTDLHVIEAARQLRHYDAVYPRAGAARIVSAHRTRRGSRMRSHALGFVAVPARHGTTRQQLPGASFLRRQQRE